MSRNHRNDEGKTHSYIGKLAISLETDSIYSLRSGRAMLGFSQVLFLVSLVEPVESCRGEAGHAELGQLEDTIWFLQYKNLKIANTPWHLSSARTTVTTYL